MKKYSIQKSCLLILLIYCHISAISQKIRPPLPYGAVPSSRQLAWHELEFYGFIHFTVNTFTNKEWGYGDEDPRIFNPQYLDVKQWVKIAKEAGMKAIILTCKHHDGFCLWSSKFTEHSVKNSALNNGSSDIVKDLADACKENGLKFGIYLSPWDRNHKDYGKPEYISYYKNQLTELLTNYGPVFEVWFDGANGGDGYYGGAKESRTIDRQVYYKWNDIFDLVRKLQPGAVMFSDAGPDIRWVGNEDGVAGETNWNTLNASGFYPGSPRYKELTEGHRNGTHWLPAETDVSIRPGWFYHSTEDMQVKTPAKLIDIYYNSVGRGTNLLLNLPPDQRGLINENDIKSLREFRSILDETFSKDFARNNIILATNFRGNDERFSPAKVIDGIKDTYWATDDSVKTPEIIINLGDDVEFNVIRIKEYIKLGQRVEGFAIDYLKKGDWEPLVQGTSIGYQKLIRTKNVTSSKLRLRITKSPVCIAISEIGIFYQKPLPVEKNK